MDGFLPIYKKDDAQQNWERVGNYLNFFADIGICPVTTLLPFVCPQIPKISGGNTISEFKLQKLKIQGDTKTITRTYTLSTSLIDKKSGTAYDRYYFLADETLTEYKDGVYQYYIKDSNNNEWISEIFAYCVNMGEYATVGDFNDDFNDDFLI